MPNLTLELPPRLAQALAARQIDQEQARQIALAALEQSVQEGPLTAPSSADEAAAFARSLIDRNRPLFEELARR